MVLNRKTPLRPGTKPLKRGGPIHVRARLERGGRLKRTAPLKKVNPERRAKLRAQQFAEQAEVCRALPCIFCGGEPTVPHHTTCRGMGGVKGKDEHCIPCCDECHEAIHQRGASFRPVDHRDLANLLHLTLRLLADRPELVPMPENREETS